MERMSFVFRTAFIFAVLILVFTVPAIVKAQQDEGDEEEETPLPSPFGSPTFVSDNSNYGWSDNDLYTTHNVQSTDEDGNVTTTHEYDHVWRPPTGRTIKSIQRKTYSNGVTPDETSETAYLLLDDGSVYDVEKTIYFGVIVTYRKTIDISGGSEGWEDLLGDDLYALSSSYVYVSRDTGYTWALDSTGLNGSKINTIAIDTGQNVWAAASKGLYWQEKGSNTWFNVAAFPLTANLGSVYVDRRNRIFVGSSNNGVYISIDYGKTWNTDTAGIGSRYISKFSADSSGTVYGLGGATQFGFSVNAIYRSVGGTSAWTRVDTSLARLTGSGIQFNSINTDGLLSVGTSFGVFTSTNMGDTWASGNTGLQAKNIPGLVREPSGRLVVSTALGIFYKDPSDTAWTKSYPTTGYSAGSRLYQDGAGTIYTHGADASITPNTGKIIIKSTDMGSTWSVDTLGLSGTVGNIYYVDEAGNQHIASSLYGDSWEGLLYVKAPGQSWTLDSMGFTGAKYSYGSVMASDRHGNFYASGYYPKMGAVVRRPFAGGAWVTDTVGLGNISLLKYMAPDTDGNMYGATTEALFHRISGIWNAVLNLPKFEFPTINAISIDSSGKLFIALNNFLGNNGVYFTTNNGTTWTLAGLDTVETNQLISYGDSTYALTVGGAYVISSVAHIVSSVQVSIDSAWNLVSVPKTRTDYSAASLFPTRIAGSTYEYKKGYAVRDSLVPGKGYWTKFHGASTDTISGTALPSLAVSVDSAWNLIGSLDHEVPVPTGGVIASNIYLYEHGYHTASTLTPGKGYWVKASHSGTINLGTRNAPKSRIKSIAELNTLTIRDVSGNHQELYFGSGQSVGMNELPPMPPAGVFDARFGDNQNVEFADEALAKEVPVSITSAVYPVKLEWTINARQTGIDTLVIDGRRIPLKSSGVVVLPAGGAGISIRLSHAEGLAKPVKFALEQNYPNPFNPTTNIQYSVPARTMVSLKIYNVIGQEVATLVNQEKEAGSYAVSFDASKLSSGVYFYRLQAGGNIDSKKLVLVK